MIRLTLGVALLAAAGCSAARCGPGTQLAQADNGDVVCVSVTVAHGETACDADGGVQLVDGNRCVAETQCGPGTTLDPISHQCLAVAQGSHDPPVCATPASGHICVNGTLRNLVDGSYLANQTVRVSLYDASSFLNNPTPPALAEVDATDTFRFSAVPTPGMYLLIVTHDSTGAPGVYQATGIGGNVTDGQSLRVDGYVVAKAQYTAWSLPAAFDSQGALLYRFFNDPSPPPAARTPTETHPVAGVVLIDGNTAAAAAGARYVGATLAATEAGATVTGAAGAVFMTSAGFGTYTGRGGGVTTWEAHQALPIPHLVQVDFLHPQP
jgi:hypothetical protein